MNAKNIYKKQVLDIIKYVFSQERQALKGHPVAEQNVIGNKLAVIEIELRKLVKDINTSETV